MGILRDRAIAGLKNCISPGVSPKGETDRGDEETESGGVVDDAKESRVLARDMFGVRWTSGRCDVNTLGGNDWVL